MKKRKTFLFVWVTFFVVCTTSALIYLYHRHEKVVCSDAFNQYVELVTFKNGEVALRSIVSGKIVSPRVDEIMDGTDDFFGAVGDTVAIYIENNKYGYLNNKTGSILISADKYDLAWNFDHKSGLAAVVENGKLGFINHAGAYVIKPQYTYSNKYYAEQDFGFEDGYSLVPDTATRKLGLIDIRNKILLTPIYDDISATDFGFKLISINDKYGLADSSFHIVINPEYDNISLNQQGIVLADYVHNRQYMIAYDYKTVISDNVFDEIIKIYINMDNYDEDNETTVYSSEESGYSKFYINGEAGIIDDKTGKIIIPAKWDEVEYHSEGIFLTFLGEKKFLINTKGKIIN